MILDDIKKELIAVAVILLLVVGLYIYHTYTVSKAHDAGYTEGKAYVYSQLEKTAPDTVIKTKTKWYSLPPKIIPGKTDTVYIASNLDLLTVDSLKHYVQHLETPFTVESNDSSMHITAKALPKIKSIVFLNREYLGTDTTQIISKTIVKDFEGRKVALTGTLNGYGQTTVGVSWRFDRLMIGPSYQIIGPAPGNRWSNKLQLNVNYFIN